VNCTVNDREYISECKHLTRLVKQKTADDTDTFFRRKKYKTHFFTPRPIQDVRRGTDDVTRPDYEG